jgi:uroporphyrinogen-III synthase
VRAAATAPLTRRRVPLAAELPADAAAAAARGAVLYPASSKARAELAEGLAARGGVFELTRLDTYDTVPASSLPPDAAAAAAAASVVTFASPSAVKAWCALLPPAAARAPAVACIGETSATACSAAGLERIHFPDAPGVDGWVEAVADALRGAPPRDAELAAARAAGRAKGAKASAEQ